MKLPPQAEVHTSLEKASVSPPESKTLPALSRLNLACKTGQHKVVSQSAGGSRQSFPGQGSADGVATPQPRTCRACRESNSRVGASGSQGATWCLWWESECLGQQEVFGVPVSCWGLGEVISNIGWDCKGSLDPGLWACAVAEEHWMSFRPHHPPTLQHQDTTAEPFLPVMLLQCPLLRKLILRRDA